MSHALASLATWLLLLALALAQVAAEARWRRDALRERPTTSHPTHQDPS
ncbi:hypothetical protein ACFYTG_16520 [Streptomyces mirabilis]